jgi:RNA recognition motif-containing protein
VGSVFIEFNNIEEATQAKEALKGKIYDGREIKAIFIQEEVFKSELS